MNDIHTNATKTINANHFIKRSTNSNDKMAMNKANINLLNNSIQASNKSLIAAANQVNSQINDVNIQNDTIYKMDELQTMQTNELNDQLRELERIQNIIATKDRLIDETKKNTETYHKGLHLLIGFIGLSILLVIPWIGYLTKNISYSVFMIIVIIFVLTYAIYVAWKFNLLYLNTIFNKKSHEKGLGEILQHLNILHTWRDKKWQKKLEKIYMVKNQNG